jgi:NAD(P)-dependent dehydrogenase (short-subunit alcohol dehydrogenase family)
VRLLYRACRDHFGSIDVLVNSAGIDFWGAIEEQNEADYRATFEVNLFGPVELIRLVLPGMRSLQRGTIVNISSLRGIVSSGGNGCYCSSKFPLEGLTEALWQEIEPLGLRALLVEPGPHRTGMDTRVRFSGSVIDAYEGSSGRIPQIMANINLEQFPGDPTRAATAIYQEVRANSKRHRMILGSEAYRQIGAKLNAFKSEFELAKDLAFSTDYPDAGQACYDEFFGRHLQAYGGRLLTSPVRKMQEMHISLTGLAVAMGRDAAAAQVAELGNGRTSSHVINFPRHLTHRNAESFVRSKGIANV